MSLTPAPDVTEGRARRWTRKPQARPDDVLKAALAAFATHGFAATRMDDIAKAAGISKAAIYLYFPSKTDVFKALVRQRVAEIQEQFEAASASVHRNPVEGLHTIARTWSAAATDLRVAALPRIILAESGRFPDLAEFYHQTVIEWTMGVIVTLIEAGQVSGQFRQIDPRTAARALVSPLLFEVLRRQTFPQLADAPDLSDMIEVLFDLFLNGLTKPASMSPMGLETL